MKTLERTVHGTKVREKKTIAFHDDTRFQSLYLRTVAVSFLFFSFLVHLIFYYTQNECVAYGFAAFLILKGN